MYMIIFTALVFARNFLISVELSHARFKMLAAVIFSSCPQLVLLRKKAIFFSAQKYERFAFYLPFHLSVLAFVTSTLLQYYNLLFFSIYLVAARVSIGSTSSMIPKLYLVVPPSSQAR